MLTWPCCGECSDSGIDLLQLLLLYVLASCTREPMTAAFCTLTKHNLVRCITSLLACN